MVERLIFIGAGAGAGEKKYQEPEPAKNGPAPQHWLGDSHSFLADLSPAVFSQLQCEFELVRIPFEEFSVIDPPSAPTVRVLFPF